MPSKYSNGMDRNVHERALEREESNSRYSLCFYKYFRIGIMTWNFSKCRRPVPSIRCVCLGVLGARAAFEGVAEDHRIGQLGREQ